MFVTEVRISRRDIKLVGQTGCSAVVVTRLAENSLLLELSRRCSKATQLRHVWYLLDRASLV